MVLDTPVLMTERLVLQTTGLRISLTFAQCGQI